MSKKTIGTGKFWQDMSLYGEMRNVASAEGRAIAKRRSAELSRGLTDNEIARRIIEARGTNVPAFSAKGQPQVIASFWKEAKAARPEELPLPKAQRVANKKTTSDGKPIDENNCMFDSGWYTKGQHPGFTRTA